ncbi:MAG: hypothetical protein LQ342_001346 [Letrouitia transgressa]|nr:MAG: hypothetical protein LQ342_001346 [Letrouitia transgressa]
MRTEPVLSFLSLTALRPPLNISARQNIPTAYRLLHAHARSKATRSPRAVLNQRSTVTLDQVARATQVPQAPDISQPLAYHVHRTASQQLPVYHLSKRAGSLLQTRIRKIEGDIALLKAELQLALGLKQENIAINQLTKHIIIKVSHAMSFGTGTRLNMKCRQGWKRKEVAQFLEARNF